MRSAGVDKKRQRRKGKMIQLAFYETSGDITAAKASRRSRKTPNFQRANKQGVSNSSLPYLHHEQERAGKNTKNPERHNSSFTMLAPRQFGYGAPVLDPRGPQAMEKSKRFQKELNTSMSIKAEPAAPPSLPIDVEKSSESTTSPPGLKLPHKLPILRLGVPSMKSRGMLIIKQPPTDADNDKQESESKLKEERYALQHQERVHALSPTSTSGNFFKDLHAGPYDQLDRDMPKLGAGGVSQKKNKRLGDRVSGVLKARTEALAKKILTTKEDERLVKSHLRENIGEARRALPLDFIFRRALQRYVKAHQESGMKRWKSFIRRSQAIERLLMKVTPYAIVIQRHIRGYLGRKRAAMMREIRRVERKRLRLRMAIRIQVWWHLMVVLEKIRVRTAINLEKRQQRSARKIQWCFRGYKARKWVRQQLRVKLTHVMRDLLRYEHMLSEEETIMVEAASAVLFDQRDDPRWEREMLYTSLDIRRAITLCEKIEAARQERARKKKQQSQLDIMREKQRMKVEMLAKQQKKYAEKLAKEKLRLAEIAAREEAERLRILEIKKKREEEEAAAKAAEQAMLDSEMDHINAVRDKAVADEKAMRQSMAELKAMELERLHKIKDEESEKNAAAKARKDAQLKAQEAKILKLKATKEGSVDTEVPSTATEEEVSVAPDEDASAPTNEDEANVSKTGEEEGDDFEPSVKFKKKVPRRGGGDCMKVVCKTAYEAENSDELNMNVGEDIVVLDRGDTSGDSRWWLGENLSNGATGIFPDDCIEVVRKKVVAKTNYIAEDEEELNMEEGDFIAIYEWEDINWWRGENLTTKANGLFPSDHVLTESEFKEEEAKRKLREKEEEEAEMERMAEMMMEGIAAQDDDDGERALQVVFDLLDMNDNNTLERKDVVYACLDGGRLENILQACGALRIWLRPRAIDRFFRCIDYPLNDGHATFDQFKAFVQNPHVVEAKIIVGNEKHFSRSNTPSTAGGALDKKLGTERNNAAQQAEPELIEFDASDLIAVNSYQEKEPVAAKTIGSEDLVDS